MLIHFCLSCQQAFNVMFVNGCSDTVNFCPCCGESEPRNIDEDYGVLDIDPIEDDSDETGISIQ